MAYTLTQARALLTAAELELFDQSRAEPIKGLTPAGLAGKVKRARTLRDKYRDLYRRQTVAVRGEDVKGRTDNERTQRKADIFQEMLERFEARTSLLQERGERDAARKPGVAKPAAAGKKVAASVSAKTAAPADKAPKAQAATVKAKIPAAKKIQRVQSSTAAATAVGDTVASGSTPETAQPKKAGAAPVRSAKAPSRRAPTAGSKAKAPPVNAPLDTVASAERASPLKQEPGNIAKHAHQSSSARRTQGKRDSR